MTDSNNKPARAVIVAAGRGSRMGGVTSDRPKCLIEFGGRPLLDYQVGSLRTAGVEDICLVTGYKSDMLEGFGLPCFRNDRWSETNMVHSLMCARDFFLSDDAESTLVCYSDIVYEPRVVKAALAAPEGASTIVDLNWRDLWELRLENPLDDAETLKYNDKNILEDIGQKPKSFDDIQGQYIGMTRFSAEAAKRFADIHANIGSYAPGKVPENCYFTDVLRGMIGDGYPIHAAFVESGWLEFDTEADYDAYKALADKNDLDRFWTPREIAAKGVLG